MNELELASRFDRQRPQLRAVAYRILGSVSELDDAALSPAERLASVLHDMFAVPFHRERLFALPRARKRFAADGSQLVVSPVSPFTYALRTTFPV